MNASGAGSYSWAPTNAANLYGGGDGGDGGVCVCSRMRVRMRVRACVCMRACVMCLQYSSTCHERTSSGPGTSVRA